MVFRKLLLLMFFTLLYSDYNISEGGEMGKKEMVIFSELDNNREINLTSTIYFSIKLETQMGTGYDWYIEEISPNIKLISNSIEESVDSNKTPLVGASSQHHFKFEILSKGNSNLKLLYKRAWEKSKKETKDFKLQINVDK